ncbi:hypothetical protein [Microbacterium sp. CJ88]|uniref:hypothetical protein n=1 Tax=Microbacterium sp. CJ88 TaxID=3445672 RepID=UPI003F65A205
MANWRALAPFFRDWIVIALVPVWLTLTITLLVRGSIPDAEPALPVAAALFAYTLALAAAFLDDFSSATGAAGFAVLRAVMMSVKWIAVVVASAAIGLLCLQNLLSDVGTLSMSSDTTLTVAIALAATCLVLSLIVTLFGQRTGAPVSERN